MAHDEAERRIAKARNSRDSRLELRNLGLTAVPDSVRGMDWVEVIHLDHNQLTALPDWLGELRRLKRLYVNLNKIGVIPESLGDMAELTKLDASVNRLSSLPNSIGRLRKLRHIHAGANRITSLPASMANLEALEWLFLDGNPLLFLPENLAQLTRLSLLYLHGAELLGLPPEVLGPSWQQVTGQSVSPARPHDILTYYYKTRRQARPLNEVKLLLVGRGQAGKSSIRDGLLGQPFDPDRRETPGIDIRHWQVDCGAEKVHVHLWDFAGQEITHATHQFFLTERSVYVLVLDARADTQDQDAEYWLRLVDGFGKGSPVIVVLNKWDEKPFAVDEHALRERYPAIRAFLLTDCKSCRGLAELKDELRALLADWKEVHEPFPADWWGVKERLTNPKENYLPFADYQQICREKNVLTPGDQAQLARILHALGVILHYADDARLRDTTVLNPHWVTTGVYTLLRLKEGPASDGTLTVKEAAAALPGEPRAMVEYLIGLMRRFELCYPLNEAETRWFVPQLIGHFQPALGTEWSAPDATRLRYTYKVVPEGLLPRFIVRTHPLNEGETRWRNGVVLRLDGATSLVRAEPQERRVSVTAVGDPAARLQLVKLVRSHFGAMHGDLRRLNPKEELEVEGHPGIFKDVQVLERNEQKRAVTTVDTEDGSVTIDPTQELNRASAPAARDPEQPRAKLFVSYSHGDRSLLDAFTPNLELLKADGLVSWWFDGQIPASAEWDRDIRRELEEADVIVLMVSTSFLGRPYIRGVELGRAIQRKAAGEVEIFILVLEPQCPWQQKRKVKQRAKDAATGAEREEEVEVELGKFQALLPKNRDVQRWPNRPAAFNHVDAALREMIAGILKTRGSRGAR